MAVCTSTEGLRHAHERQGILTGMLGTMKRCLTLGVMAMLVLALATCGPAPRSDGKIEIDVWTEFSAAPQKAVFEEIVADFNASQNEIIVTHTGFENTPYETTLKTAFSGGKPADIVEVNGGTSAFQYARAGLLVDLTDFVAPFRSVISPGMESSFEYQGKAYGVPWQLAIGNMLWYNPDMLAARGIKPSQLETWPGFLAAAETFKAEGIAPIAFGNREGWPGNHFFTHFSRRLLSTQDYNGIATQTMDPNVKSAIRWDDPRALKAWELYRDLLDKGYFTAGYLADDTPTASSQFLTGKAPFYFMGSWFMGDVIALGGKTPVDVTMFPAVTDAPGDRSDLVTNTLVFTLTKASKNPEAAKKFLAYLTTEPVQKKWAEGVQGLIPYAYDTRSWKLNPVLKRVADYYQNARSSAPFLDMLEDPKCNVPWVWEASTGLLTRQLEPADAGRMHQECVDRLRKANRWN
jgi:raffinose/stachyose/melibiose transport system substrate-binding protein